MTGDFFLTQWAFMGMRWLYETLTNESIVLTVVISTLLIRCVTVLGDIKSRKSSMKMQLIQPQLQKLQKKYQNDPQRLSIEQRKLMKDNDVSMMGGCLPMLLTLPLFFIFIAAFRQWGNEMMVKLIVTMDADPQAGLELFENFKFLWVNNMWAADNGFKPVIQTAEEFFSVANKKIPNLLYFVENPAALETFVRLGFFVPAEEGGYALVNLATLTANDPTLATAIQTKYDTLLAPCMELYAGKNNGWFIFPVLAAVTTFLHSWVMTKGQKKLQGDSETPDAAASTNKMMQWMMPIMSFYFCLVSNATFALYWTVSNVFSLLSSMVINQYLGRMVPKAEEKGVQK